MRSIWIVRTFVTLALVTLSGCADEKGAVLPSATSKPSTTSASPAPTAVGGRAGVPDEAKKHTRAGAEAFARYYLNLVNVAWTKPDPSAFEGLGRPNCIYCKEVTEVAGELASKGQRFDSPVIRIRRLSESKVEPRPGEEWFEATVEQQPANIVDSGGKVVDPQTKKDFERVVLVVWQDGKWYFGGTEEVKA